ncbi:IS30 family transposase [Terribacillus sp. FSL K6-0262]
MSYSHLTTIERGKLETLYKLGWSARRIAKELGRHHSTISRELERNSEGSYKADSADRMYQKRREFCIPKGKWKEELRVVIEEKLKLTWSPEQIQGRLGIISFKTIYRWMNQRRFSVDHQVFRQKGKRQKPRETRGRFNIGTSIKERPKDVKDRKSAGHWELDTVVSSRGKSKGCFGTFAERKTRFFLAVKMNDRSARSMKEAISQVAASMPKEIFKTATTDRGKEFACYQEIENEMDISVYFADPYAPWQRGTNENSNGLLREFFPKKTDLASVSEDEIHQALYLINHRPRKILGWKTPYEAFQEELSHLD